MVPEAPLERDDSGLAPRGEGWFVLNARESGTQFEQVVHFLLPPVVAWVSGGIRRR